MAGDAKMLAASLFPTWVNPVASVVGGLLNFLLSEGEAVPDSSGADSRAPE